MHCIFLSIALGCPWSILAPSTSFDAWIYQLHFSSTTPSLNKPEQVRKYEPNCPKLSGRFKPTLQYSNMDCWKIHYSLGFVDTFPIETSIFEFPVPRLMTREATSGAQAPVFPQCPWNLGFRSSLVNEHTQT